MSTGKTKRIGILGGTFDPPHTGHLIIAARACAQLELDRLYLVPAFVPPHKTKNTISPGPARLAMLRLAAAGNPRLRVSPFEVQQRRIVYTVETLRWFRRKHPSAELYFILGGDNAGQFDSWKSPDEIRSLARLAVYRRPGSRSGGRGAVKLAGPSIDLSSSDVRRMVGRGESIRYLVPERVEAYIRTHELYR